MASQSRQKSQQQTSQSSTLEFDDLALQSTMRDFLKDDKKESQGIINFATIAGFAMLFVCLTFLIQLIGLDIGPDMGTLISALPLIGGVLVTLVGFGFFVGDRKNEQKAKKRNKQKKTATYSKGFDVHGSETDDFARRSSASGTGKLRNDLDVDFEQFAPGYSSSSRTAPDVDPYAYRSSGKLSKSRTDKKWAGVCGGIAKYFGISSTVVRLMFVIATFMGYGSPILIYIGLSFAMPKEPMDLMDDFN